MMTLVRQSEQLTNQPGRMMTVAGGERRRGLRISQQRPIKVFEPRSARYLGGQTHDVSATGVRVELPVSAPLQPHKLISIHVGLSTQGQGLANRRQMIPARVVWVDRRPGAKHLTAGVEFLATIAAHRDAA
jgi:hypothetical protein